MISRFGDSATYQQVQQSTQASFRPVPAAFLGQLSLLTRSQQSTGTQPSQNIEFLLQVNSNQLSSLKKEFPFANDLRFFMPTQLSSQIESLTVFPVATHHPQLQKTKLRFRVNVNNGKESMIISADPSLTIPELSEKILLSFFRTFIIKNSFELSNLETKTLPIKLKKMRSGSLILTDSLTIQRVEDLPNSLLNEDLHVTIARKETDNSIPTTISRQFLQLYEQYNQRKAAELKQISDSIPQEKAIEPRLTKKQKKQKNQAAADNQSKQSSDGKSKNEDDLKEARADQVIPLPCRVLLMPDSIIIDVWDPVECENIQFQLDKGDTIDDLKWMIDTYSNVPKGLNHLSCTVYASIDLFEDENGESPDISLDYNLFTHPDSPMVFYNRLKGG